MCIQLSLQTLHLKRINFLTCVMFYTRIILRVAQYQQPFATCRIPLSLENTIMLKNTRLAPRI